MDENKKTSCKRSITSLQKMKERGEKIAMITCYDSTFARLVDQAGVDCILVGDSMGNTMLGYDTTLPVDIEDIIRSASAVMRTTPDAFVIADLPFMSYHLSALEAAQNAGRIIKETGAQAVKLEGGAGFTDVIKAIVHAQILCVAHLGLTPQSVNVFGGFKVQAKTKDAAKVLLDDARAVEEAGACMLVLEGVPAEVAGEVTAALSIPVIGIGAGANVDGQVLVLQDMLGMNDQVPKFVKEYADLKSTVVNSIKDYCRDVRSLEFPAEKHTFKMSTESVSSSPAEVEG
ncbi:MAG: 3-methyl-2-oxobutanoate hydroxymethyltransferase [Candidatus Ancillula sp.]|jgi:3-methyl-2-oxobutanoate hydroxymethyltransferase|nr:3-methyl-2-oxobutanoate hydroxymethyltransferase [Candidatus Ancillula sp.]